MKVKKRGGQTVVDICEELDTRCEKPRWVYLTEQEVEKLCRHANYKYQVLIRFLYDSGIRAPTELVNVRVRDLTEDCTQLHIREETSKTFGRKITLLHCPPLLREYIHDQGLKPDQYIFDFSPSVANRYLKALGSRVLGDGTSAAGKTYPELTLYDFRHSSACYWRPKYKHESAFMHRFGWTTADMVAYYTEFLGMHDTITDEDLLTSEAKTALERQLGAMEREKALVDERIAAIEEKLHQLLNRLLVDRRPDEPELLDPMLKPR
ncbi:MAG: hypothetical protein OXR66_01205 [Candidatus Woesearchaeota archaeon]|nr:hypothetical protein [Candidatus Woesearchaeota archaeon]